VVVAWVTWSCGPVVRPDFHSPEPAARIAAILRAAERQDRGAIPDIVRMLDSDDPATRMAAIVALERLTGERFGYDPTAKPGERALAVARWAEWVKANTGSVP
jgi:HEAT repeat protein